VLVLAVSWLNHAAAPAAVRPDRPQQATARADLADADEPDPWDGLVFTETGIFVGGPATGDGPPIPVAGIRPGDLANTYGEPRADDRSHRGIDIPARRGTPVMASADGWILALPSGGAGGLGLFLLDRTGRYLLYYAHLDAYADGLHQGLAVRRRELLGYVGTTGNAQQPHLHFEVTRLSAPGSLAGRPVNPYDFLTGGGLILP
jgi:peptidoglycan LD-endopeptidase LytH